MAVCPAVAEAVSSVPASGVNASLTDLSAASRARSWAKARNASLGFRSSAESGVSTSLVSRVAPIRHQRSTCQCPTARPAQCRGVRFALPPAARRINRTGHPPGPCRERHSGGLSELLRHPARRSLRRSCRSRVLAWQRPLRSQGRPDRARGEDAGGPAPPILQCRCDLLVLPHQLQPPLLSMLPPAQSRARRCETALPTRSRSERR